MWDRQSVRATGVAMRRVLRTPIRTGLTVGVLAAGIAAAATMLTVVDAVDFRPLPYRDTGRLVVLHEVAPPTYKWCRDCGVSPGLFGVLGVVPAIGRPLTASDTEPGAAPVTVISDALWRRGFGTDPRITENRLDVVSRITGQRQSYAIIGVMPPRFRLFDAGAWMPLVLAKGDPRSARTLQVIGRLRSSATLRTLDSQLRLTAAGAASAYPATNSGWSARAISIRDATIQDFGVGASARWLLLSIVGCLLAITLGSVVTVLEPAASARATELALRSILGASRGQLVALLALEGSLIAVVAGALAVAGTIWGISLCVPALGLARLDPRMGFDARAASFVLASTILCAVVCGLARLGKCST